MFGNKRPEKQTKKISTLFLNCLKNNFNVVFKVTTAV